MTGQLGLKILIMTAIVASSTTAFADSTGLTETGFASWYGGKFQGRQTASGEIFDTNRMTAAHKTLPFGTIVKVFNLENELEILVRINDRGPFVPGRIIDLSRAAADKLKMVGAGIARVRISVVSQPENSHIHRDVPEKGTVIIQIGAYGNRENAEMRRDALVEEGFRAELESAGRVTRVIVTNVPSEEVDPVLLQLSALGITSPLVRRTR